MSNDTVNENAEIPAVEEYSEYSKNFSPDAFWDKMKSILKRAGRELLEAALKLFLRALAATDAPPVVALPSLPTPGLRSCRASSATSRSKLGNRIKE